MNPIKKSIHKTYCSRKEVLKESLPTPCWFTTAQMDVSLDYIIWLVKQNKHLIGVQWGLVYDTLKDLSYWEGSEATGQVWLYASEEQCSDHQWECRMWRSCDLLPTALLASKSTAIWWPWQVKSLSLQCTCIETLKVRSDDISLLLVTTLNLTIDNICQVHRKGRCFL